MRSRHTIRASIDDPKRRLMKKWQIQKLTRVDGFGLPRRSNHRLTALSGPYRFPSKTVIHPVGGMGKLENIHQKCLTLRIVTIRKTEAEVFTRT